MQEAEVVNQPTEAQSELEELHAQIRTLTEEKLQLTNQLSNVTNMLRFTLGIALHAMPDLKQLKAMADNLYKAE